MNRLTFWNESLQGGAWDVPIRTSDDAAAFISSQEIIDRLAAYEDTGWTPDEIREGNALIAEAVRENGRFTGRRLFELCGAESEGRLLILPCKLGGTVYTIKEEYFNCEECPYKIESHWNSKIARRSCDMDKHNHCPLKIEEHVVKGFEVSGDSAGICISAPGEWGYEGLEHFSGYDGKWYRTREEAEAALREEMTDETIDK